MYCEKNLPRMMEVIQKEEASVHNEKDDVIRKILENNPEYLRKAYESYHQKAKEIDKKMMRLNKKHIIRDYDFEFYADRLLDAVVPAFKILGKDLNATPREKANIRKPENIAESICKLKANLEYLEKMCSEYSRKNMPAHTPSQAGQA